MQIKQPDEVLDFTMDFSQLIANGETVQAHTLTVTAGITLESESLDENVITYRLGGGFDGYVYQAHGTVTTNTNTVYGRRDTVLVTTQAPTIEDVDALRELIGDSANTYSFDELRLILFECALNDIVGEPPFVRKTNVFGEQMMNLEWIPTFDFNWAASRLWTRKANDVIEKYDFSADGGNFSRSQLYDHFMKTARYYASRRSPRAIKLQPSPLKRRTEAVDG